MAETKILKRWFSGCQWVAFMCCMCMSLKVYAQDDTTMTLEKVVVTDARRPAGFRSALPAQSLGRQVLNQVNSHSVGEAARYFSGVLVKDYGGIGGLKTISVRSLGAASTGILYDGIPVSELQTGQVDLSRFSSTLIHSLDLYLAAPARILTPARAFATSSVLALATNTFGPPTLHKIKWQAGAQAGSYGLFGAHGSVLAPLKKNMAMSAEVEGLFAEGNYPFRIDNGAFSETARRSNSDTRSAKAEVNLLRQFRDSSVIQVKATGYDSDRALPGAIIFFNTRSAQRLQNRDAAVQSRYEKYFSAKTGMLISAKYGSAYTRYTDPDFLNNRGGLDDRYTQQEWYGSAAFSHQLFTGFNAAIATDFSHTGLTSNTTDFVRKARAGVWNSVSLKYDAGRVTVTGNLLRTHYKDQAAAGLKPVSHEKYTPTVSAAYQPENSAVLFRIFYKQAFRMPTFNDLYYNFIGNRNLRPESLTQYNAGFTYSKKVSANISRLSFSADAYLNSIADKIVAVPGQNLYNWSMLNLGKVHITGVDVVGEMNYVISPASDWFTRLAYTWQQARDVTKPGSAAYGNRIPYAPDHAGSGLTVYRIRNWTAGYNVLFSSKRYSTAANGPSNKLPGWVIHDLNLSYGLPLQRFRITFKAALNNLANKHYDVVRYFPMPGRSFLFSISFNQL